MRSLLRRSNTSLLREIDQLRSVLLRRSIPQELASYYDWVLAENDSLHRQALQNLRDLSLNRDDTLDDILSQTQNLTRSFRLYDERLTTPVLRSLPSDRLCLRIVNWLHSLHSQTLHIPTGLSDGEFSIWPEPQLPVVYFMPPSAQLGLLYLPLFFHEFGHLLYAYHKPEMDDLVRDLQEKIAELLQPLSQRDDLHTEDQAKKRNVIVETWYEWTQELFCDAVGFVIGGPAFIKAFSMFFLMLGQGRFNLPSDQLEQSQHPVTWLRIRLLAERSRHLGLMDEAERLEDDWDTTARTMSISEDYYGFFEDDFRPFIQKTVNDMLTEASPYHFTKDDVAPCECNPQTSTPVHLLNRAWAVFAADPNCYDDWERQAVQTFLESSNDCNVPT
jgi:hypothetical protein